RSPEGLGAGYAGPERTGGAVAAVTSDPQRRRRLRVASRESDERPASLGEFSKAAEMAPHETRLNRSDERTRLNGSLLQGSSLESENVPGFQGKLRGPGSYAVYLSVLLPCHNEARILDRCISETVKAIATEFDETFEVV